LKYEEKYPETAARHASDGAKSLSDILRIAAAAFSNLKQRPANLRPSFLKERAPSIAPA
jgi:hypothetical protein